MQKKYYIVEDGTPKGPFSFEELHAREIAGDTRIFAKGWSKFRLASEVPELAEYISYASDKGPNASSASDKELLEQLLSQLQSQQNEIRQLREEVKKMNDSSSSKKTSPPPFIPDVTKKEVETLKQWNQELDKTPKNTGKNQKKETGCGCMAILIIALIIAFMIFY